jgi:putative transposase
MPWKETCVMDERMKFVAMLLDGDSMTRACEELGISRKTGYKFWNRYQNTGAYALVDRSRKPHRFANQLPEQIERTLIKLKKQKPYWGAPKIRELLVRKFPNLRPPAISTVHAVLDRHGLVNCRKRRKSKAQGTALSTSKNPNDLWCADFKGEFMLADRRYCYPLTISDHRSRYLLAIEALESVKEATAFPVFERAFLEHGLPIAIRTDNGVPFASPNGLFGLSRLAVWWLRLGIRIERIKPGHPEQNGRHERIHLTLKKTSALPAASNFLQQQGKFDAFQVEYNKERPHEALEMKCPGEVYSPSPRPYRGIGRIDYPMHDHAITVTHCGRICFKGKKISFSTVFAGQDVGIREVSEKIWLVSFMDYDLGYFDEDSKRFEPSANPFGPKVLPMSS